MRWQTIVRHIISALSLGLSLGAAVWIFPLLVNDQLSYLIFNKEYRDSIAIAVQIGRLDFISILLAIIGALITFMSLVGFGYIRWRAGEIAIETAEKMADKVAREAVQAYLDTRNKEDNKIPSNPINASTVSVTGAEREDLE